MKVKATLKQIAKELNVSVSVSKALNDSPEISDQTKLKWNMQSLKIISPM
jgi:LacI family transcriptional regulator